MLFSVDPPSLRPSSIACLRLHRRRDGDDVSNWRKFRQFATIANHCGDVIARHLTFQPLTLLCQDLSSFLVCNELTFAPVLTVFQVDKVKRAEKVS